MNTTHSQCDLDADVSVNSSSTGDAKFGLNEWANYYITWDEVRFVPPERRVTLPRFIRLGNIVRFRTSYFSGFATGMLAAVVR